jgi:hypothetical protein
MKMRKSIKMKKRLFVFMCLSYVSQGFGMEDAARFEPVDIIEKPSSPGHDDSIDQSDQDQRLRLEQEEQLRQQQAIIDGQKSGGAGLAPGEGPKISGPNPTDAIDSLLIEKANSNEGANKLTSSDLERLKEINKEEQLSFFTRLRSRFKKSSSDKARDKALIRRFDDTVNARMKALNETIPDIDALSRYKRDSESNTVTKEIEAFEKTISLAELNVRAALRKNNSISKRKTVFKLLEEVEKNVLALKKYLQEREPIMEQLKKKRELRKSIQEKSLELKDTNTKLSNERLNTELKEQKTYGGQFGQEVVGTHWVSVPKSPKEVERLNAKKSALEKEIDGFKQALTSLG